MPNRDETYTVKVDLDTSDLQTKLSEVRQRINDTLSMANQQLFTVGATANQAASQAASVLGGNLTGTNAQAIQSAGTLAGTMQYGASKFIGDVARVNFGTSDASRFVSGPYGQKLFPDMSGWGAVRATFEAATGYSYDPHMALTPGEARRQAVDRIGTTYLQSGASFGGMLAGQAAGAAAGGALIGTAFGGPIGGFVGSILGEKVGDIAYNVFGATLGYDYVNASQVKDFLRETSFRFAGGRFNREQATEAALSISTMQRAPELVGMRVSASDAQRMIRDYTEVGGYDMVRSAEEYVAVTKRLIENHTKVVQTLGLSSREAAQAIRLGIDAGRATELSALSQMAGVRGSEMLQYMQQSTQLALQMGYAPQGVAQAAPQTAAMVQGMIAGGQLGLLDIMRFGGSKEAVGMQIQQMGMQFAQTPQATIMMASQAPGMSMADVAGLPIQQQLLNATRNLTGAGLTGMQEFMGTLRERRANTPPEVWAAMTASSIVGTMNYLNRGGDNVPYDLAGFRMIGKAMGYDEQSIDLAFKIQGQDINQLRQRNARAQGLADLAAADQYPGFFSRLADTTENVLATTFQLRPIAATLSRTGNAISRGVEQVLTTLDEATGGPQRVNASELLIGQGPAAEQIARTFRVPATPRAPFIPVAPPTRISFVRDYTAPKQTPVELFPGANTTPATRVDPATVTAEQVIGRIIQREGGDKLVTDPADRGGTTKYGISQRAHPTLDIENLTETQATEIYKREYWDAMNADKIPAHMRDTVMDAAVNQGVGFAKQAYIEAGDDLQKFIQLRANRYEKIANNDPSQQRFLKGWMNRLKDFTGTSTTAPAPIADKAPGDFITDMAQYNAMLKKYRPDASASVTEGFMNSLLNYRGNYTYRQFGFVDAAEGLNYFITNLADPEKDEIALRQDLYKRAKRFGENEERAQIFATYFTARALERKEEIMQAGRVAYTEKLAEVYTRDQRNARAFETVIKQMRDIDIGPGLTPEQRQAGERAIKLFSDASTKMMSKETFAEGISTLNVPNDPEMIKFLGMAKEKIPIIGESQGGIGTMLNTLIRGAVDKKPAADVTGAALFALGGTVGVDPAGRAVVAGPSGARLPDRNKELLAANAQLEQIIAQTQQSFEGRKNISAEAQASLDARIQSSRLQQNNNLLQMLTNTIEDGMLKVNVMKSVK